MTMSDATFELPHTETLSLELREHALHVTLNRPRCRNAMSLAMVNELMAVFDSVKNQIDIRAIVLRGADNNFCAGGDIKDMAGARGEIQTAIEEGKPNPFAELNRQFGRMITQANQAPQVVIAILEGAVLGGGFGLACVSDVAIAAHNAQFGLPETGLGILPAQIAPFVVTRVGITHARRLTLLGSRFNGEEALRLGVAHYVCSDNEALEQQLDEVLAQVKRCAPAANRATKELIMKVGHIDMDSLLDQAAIDFAEAVQSPEGTEGTMAFVQKRLPSWAS